MLVFAVARERIVWREIVSGSVYMLESFVGPISPSCGRGSILNLFSGKRMCGHWRKSRMPSTTPCMYYYINFTNLFLFHIYTVWIQKYVFILLYSFNVYLLNIMWECTWAVDHNMVPAPRLMERIIIHYVTPDQISKTCNDRNNYFILNVSALCQSTLQYHCFVKNEIYKIMQYKMLYLKYTYYRSNLYRTRI